MLSLVATLAAGIVAAPAADATSPIDHTRRNEPFAPGESVTPQKQKPAPNESVQEKRVDKPVVEKQKSSLRDRQAPIDLTETRAKQVREKDSHRPEVREQPTSEFNHRPAAISTATDTAKPPTVAKYQDSLTAASATNMARFPAVDRATSAKINRFVFRKNPPDTADAAQGRPVIPAAGGSVSQK
jgi:hypothetical protein